MLDFDRLNDCIHEKGITKAFIAKRLGRQRSLLNDWANGKSKPSDSDLKILANLLGVSADYLLGKTDKKNEPAQNGQALDTKVQEVLTDMSDCSEDEIDSVRQYVAFLKSQRKP